MGTLDDFGGWTATLAALARRDDLSREHAAAAMASVLAGEAGPVRLAGFAVALRMKGETVPELVGMLGALLDASTEVVLPADLAGRAVDTCGTGGDASHSINVSTLAALVVAGGGVPVCKHGNRAASSATGSADVLEALGVSIELDPDGVARCVQEVGMGFCFAPRYHPALRHAGPPRRELGIPTVFNVLGPLANPARVRHQVLGVADAGLAERVLQVLQARGAHHPLVVRGDDGLDELTTTATSTMWHLDADGSVVRTSVDARDFDLPRVDAAALRGGDPATNAALARTVLDGARGPHRDVVVLNAAAGFVAAGVAADLADGVGRAVASIDSGAAATTLERLVKVSAEAAAAAPPAAG